MSIKVFCSYPEEYTTQTKLLLSTYEQNRFDLEPFAFNITKPSLGTKWPKDLKEHVDDCEIFILFWGEKSEQSEWVKKEIAYAIESDKIIVPLQIEKNVELPKILQENQAISAYYNDAEWADKVAEETHRVISKQLKKSKEMLKKAKDYLEELEQNSKKYKQKTEELEEEIETVEHLQDLVKKENTVLRTVAGGAAVVAGGALAALAWVVFDN